MSFKEKLKCRKVKALVIKHATSQSHPKAPTASQNHPQQPKLPKTNKRYPLSKQEASVKFFIGYVSETLAFLEFLRQILECLVIRATKNIEFERVVIYPFRILSGHILHC